MGYPIRNFHAHPLHRGTLDFLNEFYKLPVDPGLTAWQGQSSAVHATRLGREADLHASSPHLHQALGSNSDSNSGQILSSISSISGSISNGSSSSIGSIGNSG